MKKKLALIRHAKSSWKDDSVTDHDRPLNKRGKHDAPMMGRRLLAREARPSLILTSPAKRARQTARLIATSLEYPREFIQSEKELYLASPELILAVVAAQDDGFNDIFLVGHNPGITELASRLAGLQIDNVPTCGIVALEAEIESWSQLQSAHCHCSYFDYPRKEDHQMLA
jgi:phosphohistidine phosphatase